ncbi:MAG: hypothetical protein GF329_01940 [Candidatus Lokiarchaeota archaeon]|nr:hypothetical protein [Candidatus Lokiarchaeota archaeon]
MSDEPLFIYFIPTIDISDGEVIFTTTITEFEIENNQSDTIVIIMPNEFSIALEGEDPERVHPSPIVKMMFFDLVQNFKTIRSFDKIIIFHNSTLDKYADFLNQIKNKIFGSESIIMDIIKISREFYNQIENFYYDDTRMFSVIRKYYKKEGLVEFDETDELQKIIFDQIIKKREAHYQRKRTIRPNVIKIISGYIENAFKIQANSFWKKLKKKGKIIYYPPGIMPIE